MPIAFGECIIDSAARELRRSGVVVPLSPRAFELLGILLRTRPRAVPQGELKDRLWPDSLVGRTSLARLVNGGPQGHRGQPRQAPLRSHAPRLRLLVLR